MSPFQYYVSAFKEKFADFNGRARRSEYWYFALFNFLVGFGVGFVDGLLGLGFLLSIVYFLAALIPGLAVAIRRLHDTNRSGWYLLLAFIPIIGGLILLVWFVTEGTAGPNEYGDDPKNPSLDDDIISHLVD